MGYFDGDQRPSPGKKRQWLFSVLAGIVIGAVFAFAALPTLLNSNIIPSTWTEQFTTGDGNGENNNAPDGSNFVNVDVSTQITEVVDTVAPAVVGVINIEEHGNFWDQQEDQQKNQQQSGTGSGVIYKKADGYAFAIANHHVIAGADAVEIVLSDGNHIKAEIVGSDLFSDLAVLRMDDKFIKETTEMGSSENVKVGEPAIAIGNPLGMMFSGSVTQGVISGKQRTIPQDFNQDGRPDWQAEVIQTDAAINPGNSGGALINIKGQLIGINSMKINETAVEGIGFAIPIDSAKPIIKELEQNGKVTRPYMGVEIYSLGEIPQAEWDDTLNLPDKVEGGVYIWSVEALSPADRAGLARLDVIIELDGKPVNNIIELRKILYHKKQVGDSLNVTFYRDGKLKETTIKLSEQR